MKKYCSGKGVRKVKEIRLTYDQQKLAEQNLYVVSRVIQRYIVVNETAFGFEYDDLYQEGCIWLCRAAASFQPHKQVPFSRYAEKVVVNGLRTYCRLMCGTKKQARLLSLDSEIENLLLAEGRIFCDDFETKMTEEDTLRMLRCIKQEYTGTARLGMEAIEWKVKGYSGKEIAAMYGVRPNLVGAWISRAKQKLKKNRVFILWAKDYRDRMAS